MSARTYDCWDCGKAGFKTVTEHMVHATRCPKVGAHRVTRPVRCPCGGEVDFRKSPDCPRCGARSLWADQTPEWGPAAPVAP